MNETIFGTAAKWLWDHKPDVMLTALIFAPSIWLALEVKGYVHRLERVEEICVEIQQKEFPQLRSEMNDLRIEMNEKFQQVDKKFEKVDTELVEIKMYLKKIDTYFATTHKDYPKE